MLLSGTTLSLLPASYKDVGVIYALPATGTGIMPQLCNDNSGTTIYWKRSASQNYQTFTIPASLNQAQSWRGHAGYYPGSSHYMDMTCAIYTGTSGNTGTLVYSGTWVYYMSIAYVAYHNPINFTTQLPSATYSLYLSGQHRNNGTIQCDSGHSQILLFTPQ